MCYNYLMKIIFPELEDLIVQEAIKDFPEIEFLPADTLKTAVEQISNGVADTMISGLNYPSRDVVLACKDSIPLKSKFFSSCFVCERASDGQHFVLADGGINKLPNTEQFITIIEDSATTFEAFYHEQPRIAILSYSTYGSGGKNPDLERFFTAINYIREHHPDWLIDGEMQLDAAISPEVASKKTPESPLKGQANVLIVPDLNSGNILYKSIERFGGFTIAGPMIQGFIIPLADLSRGSTKQDIILTIKVLKSQMERSKS